MRSMNVCFVAQSKRPARKSIAKRRGSLNLACLANCSLSIGPTSATEMYAQGRSKGCLVNTPGSKVNLGA